MYTYRKREYVCVQREGKREKVREYVCMYRKRVYAYREIEGEKENEYGNIYIYIHRQRGREGEKVYA